MGSIAETFIQLEREKIALLNEFQDEVKQLELKFDARKKDLEKKCQILIEAAEITGEPIEIQKNSGNGDQKKHADKLKEGLTPYPIAIGDAVERVLRGKGKAMSIADLTEEVAKLGVTPSGNTFRSALRKDYRQRFEKVGHGIYALRDGNANNGLLEKSKNGLEDITSIN